LRVRASFRGEAWVAPNKRKILEAARKHAQKGNKDRALKEYEKLLKLDPRDAKLRLEIGDAHRRWGQVEEAIAAYSKVADQYMNEGFDARAVAVYKQIQGLDPERFESYVPLADLYQRMGLASEAIQALQTAADGFHKQGKKREALELLRKMATLDPSNTTSRIKVADLLRQEEMTEEAIAEYEAAQAELERQGEHEAAGTVLERILEVDDANVPALVGLTRNLLSRSFAERAEPFAKRALDVQGDEVSHFELLAEVYKAQGRDEEMANTYRGLADLYRQRGDEDKARDIIQRFAPPEFSAPLQPDGGDDVGLDASPSAEPTLLDDELLEDGGQVGLDDQALDFSDSGLDESSPLDDDSLLELDEEMPEVAPPIEDDLDEELEPIEGDPEQLLAEASVYLRYGKRAQAIRNLEAILEQVPGHRAALEKLGEAHADGEDASAAVDAWTRAAESAREENDLSGFGVLRDRISALDPAAAEALGDVPAPPADDLIEFDTDDAGAADADDADADDEFDLEADIDIDLEDDPAEEPEAEEEAPATDGPSELEPLSLQEAAGAARNDASAISKQKIQEELDEAEFYHQQGLYDEARAIYDRVLEAAPNHPLALVRVGEIEAAQGGAARKEPPTIEERPALDVDMEMDVEIDVDGDDAQWTDGGLYDDLELDAGEGPAADEIDVDLPDDDLEEVEVSGGAALVEPPAEVSGGAALVGSPAPEIELPDVAADAPEVEAAEVPEPPPTREIPIEPPVTAEVEDGPPDPPVAVDVPDEVVAEGLAAANGGESFDDLVLEANAGDEPDPAGESFDLAAELADVFDDASEGASNSGGLASMNEQDVFSAVFSEFKKGVEKTLGDGDHEAHYDLGIAYREMGLLDDAIGEFRAAGSSSARRLDCLHMMGVCAIDLGRPEEATAHLQEALSTPNLAAERSLGVRFELGRAFEALGDLDRAREAWQAVAAVDPTFCEVEDRIASLGEQKPEPAAGDLESFDDLFSDDDEEPAADAAGESFDDLVAEANADETPAPDPEDSGEVAEAEPAAAPAKPARRKKKISFV
jgi:tetratricopeptide (TPR) repeat protein